MKRSKKRCMSWNHAVKRARKDLKIKGFSPVGGRSAEGKRLYKRAKMYHTPGCKGKRKSRRKSPSRKSRAKGLRKYRRKHKRMASPLAGDILQDARGAACVKGRLKTPRRQASGRLQVCRRRRKSPRRSRRRKSRRRKSPRRSRRKSRRRKSPRRSRRKSKKRKSKKRKKVGYNARLDMSLGQRRGPARSKKQSYKQRRGESERAEKRAGKRKYAAVGTMDVLDKFL